MTGKNEIYKLYYDKLYEMTMRQSRTRKCMYLCSDFNGESVDFIFRWKYWASSPSYHSYEFSAQFSNDAAELMKRPRCKPILKICNKTEKDDVIGYECEWIDKIVGNKVIIKKGFMAILPNNDEVISMGKTMSGVFTGATKQICNRVLKKLNG